MLSVEVFTDELQEAIPEIAPVTDGTDVGFFRFIEGPYKGIVFTYINPRIIDNGDDVPATIKFEYYVASDPLEMEPDADDEACRDDFYNALGDILVRIIEAKYGSNDDE